MKKKSVEMRALEIACRKLSKVVSCVETCGLWPKHCTGKESTPCSKVLVRHYISLAKKEMDKEKKS